MRTLRQFACVFSVLAVASCGDDGSDSIEFDGQCDATYDFLPDEDGDPPTRTRIVINGVCQLGVLGTFDVQTFQVIDDNGDGTARLSGSTIYSDDFGNELFSDFVGTSTDTDSGVTFGGTEYYEGGMADFSAATGSADISGITTRATQDVSYLVQGEVAPN